MSVIAHKPTLDWTWPLPLYEHGGGRELSSKQWDDYKEPVIEVVPAEQLRGAVQERDEIARAARRVVEAYLSGAITRRDVEPLVQALDTAYGGR